jgi:coenzyme F420-reducing hydrogenase delta subunit
MSYVDTKTILDALKTQLESILLPGTSSGEKLFERVDFHENKKLREALKDLTIIKQRVAIIVPEGDDYKNIKEGRTIRSERSTSFVILVADRAWTKGGYDAVFGGTNNVGVLAMKDLVVKDLVASCQLGLPYVILQPVEGAQIEIADADVKDSPGRECYVLSYVTPAGEEVLIPTATWSS